LKSRARLNEDGNDEAHFLAPLEEIVARGETAAGAMLKLYHGRWKRLGRAGFRRIRLLGIRPATAYSPLISDRRTPE
jgi:hypothetical protein